MKSKDAVGVVEKFYDLVISSNRLTIVFLILLCSFSFFIRVLPLLLLKGDIFTHLDPYDSLYLLRQVELMQANFPAYIFFDPMTFFPSGATIQWGPIFPLIVTAACLAAGASTRLEIVSIAVLIPPLLGILLIPLVYLIGVRLHNRFCGIIAAVFLAFMPGNFFDVSSFGTIDHHVAEALFGCAFILTYIVALQVSSHRAKELNPVNIIKIIAFCLLCGVIYVIGYLNMFTIIIFSLVAIVFTTIQALVDFYAGRDFRYLVIVNTVVFGIALTGSILYLQDPVSFSLVGYSLGHAAACLFIIIATLVLYAISLILRKRPFLLYPAAIIITLTATLLVAALLLPTLYYTAVDGLMEGLGQKIYSVTIIEMLPLDPSTLFSVYNFGLILLVVGSIILFWKIWREKRPIDLLCLIWGITILVLAIQHSRYEYLLAAPLAVLSGICVSFVFDYRKRAIRETSNDTEIKDTGETSGKKTKTPRKTNLRRRRQKNEWIDLLFITVVLSSIGFIGVSLWSDLHKEPVKAQEGWIDTLIWLGSNSPDPGIDYYKMYSRAGFTYPDQSYGVMSWWDYGHMITYFAHRIPNTNPFQSGVQGSTGGAAFFMSGNEPDATKILSIRGSRYVITDYPMVATKFRAIALWNDSTIKTAPYIISLKTAPGAGNREIVAVQLLTPAFFKTMISRLQLFDGSRTDPGGVIYVEYLNASEGTGNPTIRFMKEIEWKDSVTFRKSREDKMVTGVNTALLSQDYVHPSGTVPALKHFRLLYESPETIPENNSMHRVKLFEYVKGARLNGSGIITLDLETNTGRKFQYIQESESGSFILPYATDVPNGATRPLGPYKVIPGNITFDVAESAVTNGLTIS